MVAREPLAYHDRMPAETSRLFEDAVDIPLWLENDRATALAMRSHRDRDIARQLPAGSKLARVRGWWRVVCANATATEQNLSNTGAKFARARSLVSLALVILGAVTGAALTAALFAYDGTHPINVVTLMAVYVVAQTLLVSLNVLLLPGHLPGFDAFRRFMGSLSPGAVAGALVRRVDARQAEALFGWHPGRSTAIARFSRWQLLTWSQLTGVTFNVAALLTAAGLIAFTDLAFGWSTTVSIEPQRLHRLLVAAALPWREWWPEAVPAASLIEATRYYRLTGAPPAIGAEALTGWWPFVLAAMTTYGLLPRVALALVTSARLRRATQSLLLEDARVTALLDRLDTPEITLQATIEQPEVFKTLNGNGATACAHIKRRARGGLGPSARPRCGRRAARQIAAHYGERSRGSRRRCITRG